LLEFYNPMRAKMCFKVETDMIAYLLAAKDGKLKQI